MLAVIVIQDTTASISLSYDISDFMMNTKFKKFIMYDATNNEQPEYGTKDRVLNIQDDLGYTIAVYKDSQSIATPYFSMTFGEVR